MSNIRQIDGLVDEIRQVLDDNTYEHELLSDTHYVIHADDIQTIMSLLLDIKTHVALIDEENNKIRLTDSGGKL